MTGQFTFSHVYTVTAIRLGQCSCMRTIYLSENFVLNHTKYPRLSAPHFHPNRSTELYYGRYVAMLCLPQPAKVVILIINAFSTNTKSGVIFIFNIIVRKVIWQYGSKTLL